MFSRQLARRLRAIGVVLLGAACFTFVYLLAGCTWFQDSSPVAVITASATSGEAPLDVHFDASRSYAPPGERLIAFEWDFGDATGGVGASLRHTYASPGAYTVELVVTDESGRSSTSRIGVTAVQLFTTTTGWDGTSEFAGGEAAFAVRVKNEQGLPVRGVGCSLATDDRDAIVLVQDPSGTYAPGIAAFRDLVAANSSQPGTRRAPMYAVEKLRELILHTWDDINGGPGWVSDDYLPQGLTNELINQNYDWWRGPLTLDKIATEGSEVFMTFELAGSGFIDELIVFSLTLIPFVGEVAGPAYQVLSISSALEDVAVQKLVRDMVAAYRERGYAGDKSFDLYKAKPFSSAGQSVLVVPREAPGTGNPGGLPSSSTVLQPADVNLPSSEAGTGQSIQLSYRVDRVGSGKYFTAVIHPGGNAYSQFVLGPGSYLGSLRYIAPEAGKSAIFKIQAQMCSSPEGQSNQDSETVSFQVTVSPPVISPVPISPGESEAPGELIETLTPTLAWTLSEGADSYEVAVSKAPYGPSNLVWPAPGDAAVVVTGTSVSVPQGKLQYDAAYRWNVRAINASITGAWSERLYFRTGSNPTYLTFDRLEISGPTQIAENSYGDFSATAFYSNGTSTAVTGSVSWSDDSPSATISSAGRLSVGGLSSDSACKVSASYTWNGVTRSATWGIILLDSALTFDRLEISGPTQIAENGYGDFSATAYFSNGTSTVVTSSVTWSENSSYASFSGSRLVVGTLSSDTECVVTASYTYGTVAKGATISVTLRDIPVMRELDHIVVSGPGVVNENTATPFTCTAYFTDGTSSDATSLATWSENTEYTAISGGVLSVGSLPGYVGCTLTASYTYNGINKIAYWSLTLLDVVTVLDHITVSGPGVVDENSSADYVCTTHLSDGTSSDVSSSVTWSENSSYASFSGSRLVVGTLSSDAECVVTASYTYGGITKWDSESVHLHDTTPVPPTPCTYDVGPLVAARVAASGGVGYITVRARTGTGCQWTATTPNSWIRITSGSNYSGDGDVRYEVDANPAGERSGTINVAGATCTIPQAGSSPPVARITLSAQGRTAYENQTLNLTMSGGQTVRVQLSAARSTVDTSTPNAYWSIDGGLGSFESETYWDFTTAGTHTIQLSVNNSDGTAASAQAWVAITAVP